MNLLFPNNDIICISDVLPVAMTKLDDPIIGAVGLRLDDFLEYLPKGEKPSVQHAGIHFVWNEKRGYHQPEQIRHVEVVSGNNSERSGGKRISSKSFQLLQALFFSAVRPIFNY